MSFSVSINFADKARLLALLTSFPRETYRGFGRAGAAIRTKLRKLMRMGGGADGVDAFKDRNEWTVALHPDRKLGGKLAQSSAIQMFRENKTTLTVGFVSGLKPYAEPFQEAESRATTPQERHIFHKLGFKTVPSIYNRPARRLIEPFGVHYQTDFLKWAIRNTEKILAGKK